MDNEYLEHRKLGATTLGDILCLDTVRMDSEPTCISFDVYPSNTDVNPSPTIYSDVYPSYTYVNHSPPKYSDIYPGCTYINPSPTIKKELNSETYQNLDTFVTQETEIHATKTIPTVSSVGCPINDSNLEYSFMSDSSSVSSSHSQDSLSERLVGLARSATDLTVNDETFIPSSGKSACELPDSGDNCENRKQKSYITKKYHHKICLENNMASKTYRRKTRKEKQKELEKRVSYLENENVGLKVEARILEEMIQAHKIKLTVLLQTQ